MAGKPAVADAGGGENMDIRSTQLKPQTVRGALAVVAGAVLATIGHFWFGVALAPSILMGVALAMSSPTLVGVR